MNNFLVRTFTGFWIVVVILGSILVHPISFLILGLVIVAGSLNEFYNLKAIKQANPRKTTGLISGIILFLISSFYSMQLISGTACLSIILIPVYILVSELFRKNDTPFQSIAQTLSGIIYVAIPLSLLPLMAFGIKGFGSFIPMDGIEYSPEIIVGFFLLLWVSDTAAYLVGSSIGRNLLFKRISPKKTIEGFVGGLIMTMLTAWLISGWFHSVGRTDWLIVALLIVFGGTLGDLVESMLKRSSGAKDSGHIMPGHGGFLDRFDGLFIAFPLLFLYLSLFG